MSLTTSTWSTSTNSQNLKKNPWFEVSKTEPSAHAVRQFRWNDSKQCCNQIWNRYSWNLSLAVMKIQGSILIKLCFGTEIERLLVGCKGRDVACVSVIWISEFVVFLRQKTHKEKSTLLLVMDFFVTRKHASGVHLGVLHHRGDKGTDAWRKLAVEVIDAGIPCIFINSIIAL